MRRILSSIALLLLINFSSTFAQTFNELTKGANKKSGFFTIYTDESKGTVLLEIDRFNEEFLYVNILVTGIGSNDLELDRGQIGDNRVVYFKRVGNKVLLVQPNLDYRAISTNQNEIKSVREAFAQSVLAGFEIKAESKNAVLIDLTDFIVQDVHGVAKQLKNYGQGSYSMDKSRSSVWFEVQKSFPDNTEMEALITLKGNPDGRQIQSVVPSPESVSFRVRHSFVRLPDSNFEPIESHPQAGYFGISYMDFASPIEENITKRFIQKHRLVKKNPGLAASEPVEPIIYYIDSGAPEPVSSALIEGASWWNQAFEAAGFTNAFRVEVLPDSADPLDVRYNVVQWVHRSTRGWSYGSTVVDPRTGEIIKGHVSLGSLRVRQDYLIATGLLSPFTDDFNYDTNPMMELALARLRQLSAHEVGHTLGIAHNFASSVNNRASVIDYPHPLVKKENNKIIFDGVYAKGIGAWDKQVVKFGYSDVGSLDANNENRQNVIKESSKKGLKFISDYDARAKGGSHPDAHLWDNGISASDELLRVLAIRKVALDNFNENAIRDAEPMTTLHEVLVPLYYFHRYQVEATVKLLGGVDYRYASKGDKNVKVKSVSSEVQMSALSALMETLKPEHLRLKKEVLELLNPRIPGYYDNRELFKGRTNPTFDPISAAEAHIQQTAELMFHSARVERIVQQHMMDSALPGIDELFVKSIKDVWNASFATDYDSELNYLVAKVLLENLLIVSDSDDISAISKKVVKHAVKEIKMEFSEILSSKKAKKMDAKVKENLSLALELINQYETNPSAFPKRKKETMPPGSPIGMDCWN